MKSLEKLFSKDERSKARMYLKKHHQRVYLVAKDNIIALHNLVITSQWLYNASNVFIVLE